MKESLKYLYRLVMGLVILSALADIYWLFHAEDKQVLLKYINILTPFFVLFYFLLAFRNHIQLKRRMRTDKHTNIGSEN